MIEELKAHSDFKATGLPWLERIPSHWNLVPNRALVRRRKQRVGRNHHRYRLLSLTKQGVIVRDVASGKGKFSSDMGTSQEVRAGDLVFCFFDVPETPRTVGLSPHHGMITGAYTVLEPLRPGVARYFELFYRAMDDSKLLSPLYSGLRNTIPVDRFLGTKTPLPPPEEQEAIVRFLDHANRHIDQFIRAKKKLIALLNEQKQAIILRAVTRGLDPSVRLKDSGDTWFGEMPATWSVQRLWTLSRPRSERNPGNLQLLSVFLDRGVIPYGEGGGQVHAPSLDLSTYQVVHPGDFVLNNQQAWRGSVGVSRHHGIISPAYIVLDVSERIDPAFGNYLFRSRPMVDQFVAASKGVGDIQRQVYWPLLRRILVPIPPMGEQVLIATSLDEDLKGLNSAIRRTEAEVLLLNEYRHRLVADAVTGQFDVRAAAASLPVVEPEATPSEFEGAETDTDDGEAA